MHNYNAQRTLMVRFLFPSILKVAGLLSGASAVCRRAFVIRPFLIYGTTFALAYAGRNHRFI